MTRTQTCSVPKFLVAALVAVSLFSPVSAALGGGKGPSPKGGKKPIGAIVSFDAASGALRVELKDGSSFEGVADGGTKVKIDHRGKPGKKGNPTKGTLDDLVAGYKVLRLKSATTDGQTTVDKIKVRKVASTTCTDSDGDVFDDSSGAACQGAASGGNGGDAGDGASSP